MPHDIIIAIDGFASSGKSTIAKQLAAALQYTYIDSGAFYRATTLYFLKNNIDWKKKGSLMSALQKIELSFEYDVKQNQTKTYLNGENVESEIRDIYVSDAVSEVSTIPELRNFIAEKLRQYGRNKRIVMDGRDIGTVVFPDAELKIYMTADQKIRSERRFNEMVNKGVQITEDRITQNLSGRDLLDSTRPVAPLKKADDAIVLDNTNLSMEEQFNVVLKLAKEKMEG